MAKLQILRYPDPRLHTVAKPVLEVDARIRQLVDDMLESMYAADGVGLAATQVDVHERVIVIDTSDARDDPPASRDTTASAMIERGASMASVLRQCVGAESAPSGRGNRGVRGL